MKKLESNRPIRQTIFHFALIHMVEMNKSLCRLFLSLGLGFGFATLVESTHLGPIFILSLPFIAISIYLTIQTLLILFKRFLLPCNCKYQLSHSLGDAYPTLKNLMIPASGLLLILSAGFVFTLARPGDSFGSLIASAISLFSSGAILAFLLARGTVDRLESRFRSCSVTD